MTVTCTGATSAVTAEDFKAGFRHHASGVAVVTADNGSQMAALTATSVFSVSVEPNLVVFSVSDSASAAPVLTTAATVVIHLLDADNLDIAQLGSTSGIDRFADTTRWRRLSTGEPVFRGVHTWIRGHVVDRVRTGAATLIVVEADRVALPPSARASTPLVHHNRTWHRLGDQSRV